MHRIPMYALFLPRLQADASQVAVPLHAFDPVTPDEGSNWLFGSLPREAVCTENLTPWLKLLPCQGRQGLTQLMDRPTLYGASFHAMKVNLKVHTQPNNTCSPDAASSGTCPSGISGTLSTAQQWQSNVGQSDTASTATLTQTLTLVLRPDQLHKDDHITSTSSQLGQAVHQNLDFQLLFNAPGVAACSKASHTYVYFHLSKTFTANVALRSNATDLQSVDNKLHSVAPMPDAVVSSSSGIFAVWNLTAGLAGRPDTPSEQCLQPSLTWHQQPQHWTAANPPVQVCVKTRAWNMH